MCRRRPVWMHTVGSAMPREKSARKLKKQSRKRLTRRLRDILTEQPLEIAEMEAALGLDEAAVLLGLRELGERKRGRLRSGVRDGRNCWWWEPPAGAPPQP